MKTLRSWTLLAALCLCAVPAGAVPARTLLDQARAAASRGDWNASARAYSELVAAGFDHPDVLYDLGTVLARAGRFGEAIHRLEQAQRRAPFDESIGQNLRTARLALAHRDAARTGRAVVETAQDARTWLAELAPRNVLLIAGLLGQLLLAGAWLAARRARRAETAAIGPGLLVLASAMLLVPAVAGLVAQTATPESAVVLHGGTRLGRTPASDTILDEPIREGERVTVAAREGTFAQIRLADGRSGWVPASELGALDR